MIYVGWRMGSKTEEKETSTKIQFMPNGFCFLSEGGQESHLPGVKGVGFGQKIEEGAKICLTAERVAEGANQRQE